MFAPAAGATMGLGIDGGGGPGGAATAAATTASVTLRSWIEAERESPNQQRRGGRQEDDGLGENSPPPFLRSARLARAVAACLRDRGGSRRIGGGLRIVAADDLAVTELPGGGGGGNQDDCLADGGNGVGVPPQFRVDLIPRSTEEENSSNVENSIAPADLAGLFRGQDDDKRQEHDMTEQDFDDLFDDAEGVECSPSPVNVSLLEPVPLAAVLDGDGGRDGDEALEPAAAAEANSVGLILQSLGLMLHDIFSATASRISSAGSSAASPTDPFQRSVYEARSTTTFSPVDDRRASSKRGKTSGVNDYGAPLRERGVPVALSELVADLLLDCNALRRRQSTGEMTAGSSSARRCYLSVAEVERDLGRMAASPERFLVDADPFGADNGAHGADAVNVALSSLETGDGSCSSTRGRPRPRRAAFPMPARLYGRRDDASALEGACERLLGRRTSRAAAQRQHHQWQQEILLVSGYSGTGKTAIVRQVARERFEANGGLFLSGKFDEMTQRGSGPLAVVAAAFDAYFDEVVDLALCDPPGEQQRRDGADHSAGQSVIKAIKAAVQNELGPDAHVLADSLLPYLSVILGPRVGRAAGAKIGRSADEGGHRLGELFRRLLRAVILGSGRPVLLFLDDLQWADSTCLDLVRWLVTDRTNPNFLFVGAYRDNEVGVGHPLMTRLVNAIENDEGTSVARVHLQNLTRDDLNHLLSDSLRLPPQLTSELASVVHAKTGGNALFVVQLLCRLTGADDNLLCFSLESRRWEWDVVAIRARKIDGTVADLLVKRILDLPEMAQWVLMAASCFGLQCEEFMLRLLGKIKEDNESVLGAAGGSSECVINAVPDLISECINILAGAGLVYRVGDRKGLCVFSHDKIHSAAYSGVPEAEQMKWHLQIGQCLRRRLPADMLLGNAVFIVVDQLDRGLDLIPNDDLGTLADYARLNLAAGEKALHSASYVPAAIYLQRAIVLLGGDGCWKRDYDLSLRLHDLCTEALSAKGHKDTLSSIVTSVLNHARCFEDKLNAHYAQILSLASTGSMSLSVNTGLEVLQQLGEHFPCPQDVRPEMVVGELKRTLAMLQEAGTIDDIANMAKMQDSNKIITMLFLARLSVYDFMGGQKLFAMMACRLVQLTLSSGVHEESAFGFALFGSVLLTANIGGARENCAYGKVALSLLQRFKARNCLSRVYLIVFGYLNTWIEPVQAALEMHLHAQEVGLLTGDVWHAVMNGNFYIVLAFMHAGIELNELLEEAQVFMGRTKEYGLQNTVELDLPFLQGIANLMGRSVDPMELTGEFMDQAELMKVANAKGSSPVVIKIYYLRLWLAVFFQRHELAGCIIEEFNETGYSKRARPRNIAIETFCNGLAALALVRTKGQKKWLPMASAAIEKMKGWVTNCSEWNFQHRLELLQAEEAFLVGRTDLAATQYALSIDHACKRGFTHEAALACEKAAVFFAEQGNTIFATDLFKRSQTLYTKWGAHAKSNHIAGQMASLGLQ